MFTCLNANLYAIYIQFSRFLRNRRFAPKGFDPYIIYMGTKLLPHIFFVRYR